MGKDEDALLRLWREKRGEVEPEDLSGNLVVQLGLATEELNRRWYVANSAVDGGHPGRPAVVQTRIERQLDVNDFIVLCEFHHCGQ
jgi:hypothetical protein